MMTQEYSPSGKYTPAGLVMMVVAGLVAALGGAYIYYLLDRHACTFIIVFPLALGALVGAAMGLGIRWGKVRNATLALGISILLGAFAYVMSHYWSYLSLPSVVAEVAREDLGVELSREEAKELSDLILEEDAGSASFFGYLSWIADEGISIGGTGGSDEGFALPTWLAYPLLVVELVCSAGAAAAVSMGAASSPFCELDEEWHKEEVLVKSSAASAPGIARAIEAGDFSQLPALIEAPEKKLFSQVKTEACPRCKEAYVTVSVTREKKSSDLLKTHLASQQSVDLEAALSSQQG